ncbi:MAG: TIGR00341 family protein [Candidatus Heimdallarchaeota archaeon]|nr:TIGR00341 family protein [Candidatus Heimdallarchaeota archaeon]
MKEIRIEIPSNQIEVLEDYIEHVNLKASSIDLNDGGRMYMLKVEDHFTNNLLHELKARGIGTVFGTISIVQLNLFLNSSVSQAKVPKSTAANLEEILANIEDTAVVSSTYITLVILSGALAAFGLLSNSVVIIIGSMIVAPLMGPIALTSIGVLMPQRGLFRKGLIAEGLGIFLTIGVAWVIGIADRGQEVTEQMEIRAAPEAMDVAFAVISAIAAGVIISKGQSLSIVGVAIAASLAPPAANIGLMIAFGDMGSAGNSAVLLIINILAINASCSIIFILFRLPAKSGMSRRRATRAQKMSQRLTLFVLLVFIIFSIYVILGGFDIGIF